MDHLSPSRPWWALLVAAAAVVVAVVLVASLSADRDQDRRSDGTSEAAAMLAVAPGGEVALADLPADHRVLYEAAAADPEAFTAVSCYCGCESFLDHADLRECFVRTDGGWEAHATGCAVCRGEAEEVAELRGEGVPIDEIVRRIDDRYAAITS